MRLLEGLALVASVVMPMWNIPLIVRIVKRKSSEDISLSWVWGVWVCMLLMVPWALVASDMVLKVFTFVNIFFFSGVLIVVMKYKKGCSDDGNKEGAASKAA